MPTLPTRAAGGSNIAVADADRRGHPMSDNQDPRKLLPLSPPVYHVLLALGGDAMHGYAIMQAFADKTSGQEELLPGTLYATISRMVDAGLIEELAEAPPESSDKRRRYYRVTDFGRAVARAESDRIHRLLAVARREQLAPDQSSTSS
jgi:DNA-binding PadR family transcriptional regulator